MGNLMCQDAALITAVARDFCPFPNYSPSPHLNMLSGNSSQLLSHYGTVQASLTPQQQQDFTQSLRSTFGREGKVSHGGMGIVALSLAVLFDTVARQVKGECESNQEPIPGLFLRDPTGTYSPPIHTISKYLRLVPHIANNPTRMSHETEKYLHELKDTAKLAEDMIYGAQQFDDTTAMNLMKCGVIAKSMLLHLKRISNKTIDMKDIKQSKNDGKDIDIPVKLNCDSEEASKRLLSELDSFDDRTKEAFKNCDVTKEGKNFIKEIADVEWSVTMMSILFSVEDDGMVAHTEDFDLKANALGKWT